jgi:hypothetical protein
LAVDLRQLPADGRQLDRARSPQVKGRIERRGSTFQDWLVVSSG